jgi:cytochrome c peroxidase
VYFNHSAHINKGISCAECHGRVDQMPLVYQANTLHMRWCLECHVQPEKFVRPKEEITNMAYEKPANQVALGEQLVEDYHINSKMSCSACHR